MAKKKNQSLTERIAALINRVGEKPEPTFGDIKSELVECLNLAGTLENGAVVRDLEAKVTVLEAALEKSNLENGNLSAELKAFRAERKKQEEERRKKELPPKQFEILQGLPTEHMGDGATLKGISQRAKIPPDESAVHLNRLEKAGFAECRIHHQGGTCIVAWYRTIAGDELVLARRLAGEEEAPKPHKHADLPKIQHDALLMIAAGQEEGAIYDHEGVFEHEIAKKLGVSLLLAQHHLKLLRKAEMATDGDEPQQSYGVGQAWWLLDNGSEYLAERGQL